MIDTGYLKYSILHKEEIDNQLVKALEHHKCLDIYPHDEQKTDKFPILEKLLKDYKICH